MAVFLNDSADEKKQQCQVFILNKMREVACINKQTTFCDLE